jgi:DNA-binding NarL/FixJ family response regulator
LKALGDARRGDVMSRTQSERELDIKLAEAMRTRLDELAENLIRRYDSVNRDSSLSTLPYGERMDWVMLEMRSLIKSIEDGMPHARTNAYRPSATAFSQTSIAIVSSIVNAFYSAQTIEEVALELLWEDYKDDSQLFSAMVIRLHAHSAEWVRQGIAESDDFLLQLEEAQRRAVWRELKGQLVSLMYNSLIPILTSIRVKTAQARRLLEQGNSVEALVILSEMKLLSSDAMEFALSSDDHFPAEPYYSQSSSPSESRQERMDEYANSSQMLPTHETGEGARSNNAEYPVSFTKREVNVVSLLVEGKSNAEIASALDLSELTVKSYLSNILAKTQTTNRTQLAVYAVNCGIVPEE